MNNEQDPKTTNQEETPINELETISEELEAERDEGFHEFDPKHSKLGIASFLLAIATYTTAVIMVFLAVPAITDMFQIIDPENTTEITAEQQEQLAEALESNQTLAGVLVAMMAAGGFCFIGLILGIVALFTKNRKKLFAVIGTIFNGLPIAVIFLFLAAGFFLT